MSFWPAQFKNNPYHLAFCGLLLIHLCLILTTFRDYGITSDETHHIRYGADIVNWYTSSFQDRALFHTKNTYLYGGFFDTAAYLFSQIVPLDRYDANHLFNALFGLLGIIAAYRIGTHLSSPALGFFCALALVLTPRYYGHAFNNPKDIPFAVCYLWSLYYILRYLNAWLNPSRNTLIKLGLVLGCTLGMRIGGVLLIFYFVLFLAFQYRQKKQAITLKQIASHLGITLLITYSVMLIFWPYAQTHPLSGPITALLKFSSFAEPHISFFQGQYVQSTDLPRFYAPDWLMVILPEFVLLGLLTGLALFIFKRQIQQPALIPILFAGLFPILYAVIMRTPLYDGLRHLLFTLPPLVIFATTSIYNALLTYPRSRQPGLVAAILLLLWTTIEMVRLHPNQYIYFNTLIAGGIEKAAENYETDYWENSFKQGIRWLEKNVPSHHKQSISGFSENIQFMANTARFSIAPQPETANFYLGVTRYDRHRKVPGEILHVVKTHNVPILYIIRPDSTYRTDPFFDQSFFMHQRLGEIYEAKKDPHNALKAFQKARNLAIGNSALPIFLAPTYAQIGNQYDTLQDYEAARDAYFKALSHEKNGVFYNNIGVTYIRQRQDNDAIRYLQKAIDLSPDYYDAYVNLGAAYSQSGAIDKAIEIYQKALSLQENPSIRLVLGDVFFEQSKFEAAIHEYLKIIENNPHNPQAYHAIAVSLAKLERYDEARAAAQKAIEQAPDYFDAYFTSGSIATYQKNYPVALAIYQRALEINPQSADTYVGIGIALLGLNQTNDAQQAFAQALRIHPNHPEAQRYLQTITR